MAEKAVIDYLIIGHHVEAQNGLLYVSGGGWTEHVRRIGPQGMALPSHFGIGLAVGVPWNATNEPVPFVVRVESDDATAVLVEASGVVNVGRPPSIPPGSDQHATLAVAVDTVFPQAGGYRVFAQINGEGGDVKTWAFRVHDQAP